MNKNIIISPDIELFLERESLIVISNWQLISFDWELWDNEKEIRRYLDEVWVSEWYTYVLLKNSDIDIIDETIKATKGELDYLD